MPDAPDIHGRIIVAAILLAGWTAAGVVWVTSPPPVEDEDLQELQQSKRYLREVERIGGKAAVFTSEADAWLASLWEGRTRGVTIAVATAVVAGGYALARSAGRRGERRR